LGGLSVYSFLACFFFFFPIYFFLFLLCKIWLSQYWGPPKGWSWTSKLGTQVQEAGPPEISWPHGILICGSSLKGLHLITMIWSHSKAIKLHGQMPHTKQLAKHKNNTTNYQTNCAKSQIFLLVGAAPKWVGLDGCLLKAC